MKIQEGDLYDGEKIQKAIDTLTNAAGTRGYAFAEVHPRIKRDHDARTIGVILKIDQGPRVYVENINITGNNRTLDKVARREFRLVEGRRVQPRPGRPPRAPPHPQPRHLQRRRHQAVAGLAARTA